MRGVPVLRHGAAVHSAAAEVDGELRDEQEPVEGASGVLRGGAE